MSMKKMYGEGIENEDAEISTTPRLPVFSTSTWDFRFQPDPPGMKTPPLNKYPCSVPFNWEHTPGHPKHIAASTGPEYDVNKQFVGSWSVNGLALDCKTNDKFSEEQAIVTETDVVNNTDTNAVGEKLDINVLGFVVDVLVSVHTASPCSAFIRRRRMKRRLIVRNLGRRRKTRQSDGKQGEHFNFFAAMWRLVRCAMSLTSRKSKRLYHSFIA